MHLKIISSSKTILDQEADAVKLPGAGGQMQILNNHANMISKLDIGEATIKAGGSDTKYFLNGGFVIVRDNEVLVLADDVALENEVREAEIEKSIKDAEEKLQGEMDAGELIQLEKRLRYEKFKKQRVTV